MQYPDLIPDYFKRIDLPTYGVEIIETQGWENRINKNLSGIGAKIQLVYEQRNAIEVQTIMDFYSLTRGGFKAFTVPLSIWQHPNIYINELTTAIQNVNWVFDGGVRFTTLKLNVYNFEVNLRSVPAITTEAPISFPDYII
jgi:hypothetical protein